jgi:hypothetical protein
MARSVFVSVALAVTVAANTAASSTAGKAAAVETIIAGRYLDRGNGTLFTVLNAEGEPDLTASPPRALEAGPIYGSIYLDTLLLQKNADRAREIYRGLIRLARASGIPGLIARGIYPDGKRYYGDPSVMDYAALHYGLFRYFEGGLATPAEKDEIRSVVAADLTRLEEHRFIICNEVDDPTSYHELAHPGAMQAEHLLFLLLTANRITGNAHWLDLYEQRLPKRINRIRFYDRGVPQNAWAMHRALMSLTVLADLDSDAEHGAAFRQGIRSAVSVAAKQTDVFRQYLEWARTNPEAGRLTQQPVAAPIMVPLFPAHEVIRFWHGGGAMPEFETVPPHRLVWYSAEAFAASMLAADTDRARNAAKTGRDLLETVDWSSFRDVRPLIAVLSGYWRGRARGAIGVSQ